MTINTENKDKIAASLTASGACLFRKDFQNLKEVKKINKSKEVIITKKIRAALFPLDLAKIGIIFGAESVTTLNDGVNRMLGKSTLVSSVNAVFRKSDSYERLAKMDYEKASEIVVSGRIEKINKKETELARARNIRKVL